MDYDSDVHLINESDAYGYKGLDLLYKYDKNLAEYYCADPEDYNQGGDKKVIHLYLLNRLLEKYVEEYNNSNDQKK